MNLNSPIGWCDATWNPITGCLNNCPYCYARKLAEGRLKGRFGYENGFKPTLHADRLSQPHKLKKPSKIFVCSMGELFGNWIPQHWFHAVWEVIKANPQHTFQLLTKCPQYIGAFFECENIEKVPANVWVGVSVTCKADLWRIDLLRKYVKGGIRFVSFEPLMEDIRNPDLTGIDWVIIGAETGSRKDRVRPMETWLENLSAWVHCKGIPLFQKDNIRPHVQNWSGLWQEFPILKGGE